MELIISSPEGIKVNKQVDKVTFPGLKGKFTVLTGHAPIIAALKEGEILYYTGGEPEKTDIKNGFVMVKDNKITVII